MSASPPAQSIERPPGSSPEAGMVDPHQTYLGTKYFSSLNGIRCLCCLVVIKEHAQLRIGSPKLFDQGWLGVDLFFGISGFLIVTLLIRERERRGRIDLGKFYSRRTLRIFPIYYLMILSVLLIYLAISPWRPNGLRYYGLAFPVLLTYTQDIFWPIPLGNFFHCWTLAMEEQFYLAWPTVEKYAGRVARWVILLGALALNQGVNFGLFNGVIARVYGNPDAVMMPLFLMTFTPILLGVMLAYLLHERWSYLWIRRVLGYRWSPFVVLGLLVAATEVHPEFGKGWPRLGVDIGLAALLASLVLREDTFARPILTFAPIARIGVVSYGVYLYHVWVISAIGLMTGRLGAGWLDRPIVRFLVATALTVAVAEISFRVVEQPLLRLKHRFDS